MDLSLATVDFKLKGGFALAQDDLPIGHPETIVVPTVSCGFQTATRGANVIGNVYLASRIESLAVEEDSGNSLAAIMTSSLSRPHSCTVSRWSRAATL